jgi:hypothetical protein
VEIKEICMRRALLELLRKPVNTGVAIGLLFGLAYLEFSASAQPTQAPETTDASKRPTRCHDQFVIGHVNLTVRVADTRGPNHGSYGGL